MDLKQKRIVLTGSLGLITRTEAVEWITQQGGIVQSMVNKDTDLLILGFRQVNLFEPDKRTRKQKRAEEINKAGGEIQFISGELFLDHVRKNSF